MTKLKLKKTMFEVTVSQRRFYIWKLELWWIAFDKAQFYPEGRIHVKGNWFWRKNKKTND